MQRSLVFIAAMLVAATAQGQSIYKCSNGKGGNTYQQTPCEKATETKTVYTYKQVPDAPHDYGQPGQAQSYSYDLQPQQRYVAPRQSGGGLISNPSAPGLQDKLRRIASDPAYRGSPSARRAATNAAMQEAGYQSAGDYRPPANPASGIGQPVQVLDRDTMLPIPGAIKVAPNRIWDPNTGQYLETTP